MGELRKARGDLEVGFRPDEGGRLARLRHRGVDLVLPPGGIPGFYGDTFWPSPQSLFDWPPPAALDARPYEVLADTETRLVLRSGPDEALGLRAIKAFELADDALDFELTLVNISSRPVEVAPWQVTRAPVTGLLVWEPGEPFADAERVHKQRVDPGCFFDHPDAPVAFAAVRDEGRHRSVRVGEVQQRMKYFTDARGWLAHVHDGALFLRTFPDLTVAQAAPLQAELELFFAPDLGYIELENQGPYQRLEPGERLDYATRWRFASVDPAVPTDRVSADLLAAIESLLGAPAAGGA